MATGFQSFNRSALGAFIKSPLGVRGDEGSLIAIDAAVDYYAIAASAGALIDGSFLDTTHSPLPTYVCPNFGSPSAGTRSATHGRVDVCAFDPGEGSEPTLDESDHYAHATTITGYIYYAASFPSDAQLIPMPSGEYGLGFRLPKDTSAAPLYFVVDGKYPSEANRTVGAPGCGTGWSASAPPATIVHQDGSVAGTSGGSCYHVWKRADADSAWAEVGAPWDSPNGGGGTSDKLTINQYNSRIYARLSTWAGVEHWPIETQYSAASPSTITIPASYVNDFRVWEDWVVIKASSGDVYCYWQGSLKKTLATGTDMSSGWDWFSVGFGVLAITANADAVWFWELSDAGVVTAQGSVSGDYYKSARGVDPCGSGDAVVRDSHLRRSGSTWSDAGTIQDITDLIADGYAYRDTAYQYALLGKSGATPNHYLVPVF